MIKYINGFTVLLISLVIVSCNDNSDEIGREREMRLLRQYIDKENITTEPLSSGLYYIPLEEGQGLSPEKDDWVIIRYTGKTINDRVFATTDEETARRNYIYSSSNYYGNTRFLLSQVEVQGIIEGLMLMKENGRATLIIPSNLAYGSKAYGTIQAYSTLIYDIELIKVIKDPEEYEEQVIDSYISLYADSTHLTVIPKESGLYYIEISEGTGDHYPENKDKVSVFYKGMHTDGYVFDSNFGGSVFRFTIGHDHTISGFEEGVTLMKKGGVSRIVVPSYLGYGEHGSGVKIPGYTPMVFDLLLEGIQVESE